MRPRTCPGEPRPEGQRSSLVGVLVTAGVLAALELVLVVWSAALVLARLARGDVTAQLGPFASASEIAVTRARFDLDRSPGGQCIVWASRAVRIDCQACGAGRWRLLSRYLPAGGLHRGAGNRPRACTIGAMKPFSGVFTPIITPFSADGAIDEAGMRRNVARWMATPMTGLVVLGSNGEAPQIEDAEADWVIDIVRSAAPRDRPLIAGTGRESTTATIAATRRAAAAGVDAVLVRTPSFFKAQMTTEVFVRHYTEVADASPVPVLLYNVTMFTGVTLTVDAVATLASHPNIVGMKESGSDLGLMAEYIARTPDDFTVLAGSGATLYHALCAGCDGAILALAALVPRDVVGMAMLLDEGRLDEGRALQRRLMPLARSVGALHGVPGLKAALELMGFAAGPPRPPLRPVSPKTIDLLRVQLDALGVLEKV